MVNEPVTYDGSQITSPYHATSDHPGVSHTLHADSRHMVAIPLEGNGARPSHRGDGYGKPNEPMFTLNRTEVHAVAYGVVTKGKGDGFIMRETHGSLSTGGGQAGQGYPACLQPLALDLYNQVITGDIASCIRAGASPDTMPCVAIPISMDMGGGKSSVCTYEDLSPTLCTTHYGEPAVCYGVCGVNSNSMLSDNPHSGFYEASTSRTLDVNGGNPNCNQGGGADS